ncbi:hypothetical protein VE00_05442 [Pseudogymnoascus sp. WSF 3629]|nr:hypothetical protein VE00_05442 [Pseudogymnoascus sp. WSF 3629]
MLIEILGVVVVHGGYGTNQGVDVWESLLSMDLCSSLAPITLIHIIDIFGPQNAPAEPSDTAHTQDVTCPRRASARTRSLALQGFLAPVPFCGKAPEPRGCHSAGVPDGCASFWECPESDICQYCVQ